MFGIAYLSPDEVEDSFVEDYMSVAPDDEKSTMFADYLTNTYMTQESLFPFIDASYFDIASGLQF
jgi:hypothetical protein